MAKRTLKLRIYDFLGEILQENYYDNMVKLLQDCVSYEQKYGQQPSIFILNEDGDWCKVHDFNYDEATLDNCAEYTKERGIDNDYLLENYIVKSNKDYEDSYRENAMCIEKKMTEIGILLAEMRENGLGDCDNYKKWYNAWMRLENVKLFG